MPPDIAMTEPSADIVTALMSSSAGVEIGKPSRTPVATSYKLTERSPPRRTMSIRRRCRTAPE